MSDDKPELLAERVLVNKKFLERLREVLDDKPNLDLRPLLEKYSSEIENFNHDLAGHNLPQYSAPLDDFTFIEKELRASCPEVDQATTNNLEKRRQISWNEYFMSVALLAARRSKDPCTQVGACIVNFQNKIVATGYNGMPNGVNDDLVPWTKGGSYLESKYAYVVHAELNAILNSILTDQTGCRLYVSLFPCNECAKAIIQSGIRLVIYLSDKHREKDSTKAAKRLFKLAGVTYKKYSAFL